MGKRPILPTPAHETKAQKAVRLQKNKNARAYNAKQAGGSPIKKTAKPSKPMTGKAPDGGRGGAKGSPKPEAKAKPKSKAAPKAKPTTGGGTKQPPRNVKGMVKSALKGGLRRMLPVAAVVGGASMLSDAVNKKKKEKGLATNKPRKAAFDKQALDVGKKRAASYRSRATVAPKLTLKEKQLAQSKDTIAQRKTRTKTAPKAPAKKKSITDRRSIGAAGAGRTIATARTSPPKANVPAKKTKSVVSKNVDTTAAKRSAANKSVQNSKKAVVDASRAKRKAAIKKGPTAAQKKFAQDTKNRKYNEAQRKKYFGR
jgi:hypothetical protein